jgi:hypothetical protein
MILRNLTVSRYVPRPRTCELGRFASLYASVVRISTGFDTIKRMVEGRRYGFNPSMMSRRMAVVRSSCWTLVSSGAGNQSTNAAFASPEEGRLTFPPLHPRGNDDDVALCSVA